MYFRLLVLLCCFSWLQGCTTLTSLQGHIQYQGDGLKKTYYQVKIPTHDGLNLTATVFQPAIPAGEPAPVIVHAHGFGVWRVSSPSSLYAKLAYTGEAALAAWEKGYWVISYDQRGFGSSEGKITLMHPEKEVKDVSSVIDWAIQNIPNLMKDADDYAIGMIGESYGGGAQLLASVFDARIDAIVPVTTWHDLSKAIELGAAKTLWGAVLYSGGEFGSAFSMEPDVRDAFQGALTNDLNALHMAELKFRSMSHYCDTEQWPHADALLIQAFTDTVLPVNHALANKTCFEKAGRDVRAILVQNGHNMPLTDGVMRMPLYSVESTVHCGSKPQSLVDMALHWWDEKLKQVAGAAEQIPSYCITFNEEEGVARERPVVMRETFQFEPHSVAAGWAGIGEWALQPMDMLLDLFRGGSEHSALQDQTQGGVVRPLFIPLKQMTEATVIYGAPIVQLHTMFELEDENALLYVGVGLKEAGDERIQLLDFQVQALTQTKVQQGVGVELPVVSASLEQGDVLGLLVYGYHSHYLFRGPFWPKTATISGEVSLPFLGGENVLAQENGIAQLEPITPQSKTVVFEQQ